MNSKLFELIDSYFQNNGAREYAKEICVNLVKSIEKSIFINKHHYTPGEQVHQFSENIKEHVTNANDNEYLKILENFFLKHFKLNNKLLSHLTALCHLIPWVFSLIAR